MLHFLEFYNLINFCLVLKKYWDHSSRFFTSWSNSGIFWSIHFECDGTFSWASLVASDVHWQQKEWWWRPHVVAAGVMVTSWYLVCSICGGRPYQCVPMAWPCSKLPTNFLRFLTIFQTWFWFLLVSNIIPLCLSICIQELWHLKCLK